MTAMLDLDLQALLAIVFTSLNNLFLALTIAPALSAANRVTAAVMFGLFDGAFSFIGASAAGFIAPNVGDAVSIVRAIAFIAIGVLFAALAGRSKTRQTELFRSERARIPKVLLLVATAAVLSTDNLATGAAVGLATTNVALYALLTGFATLLASAAGFAIRTRWDARENPVSGGMETVFNYAPPFILVVAGLYQLFESF